MIISFYSYKGGVGRTQLCANIAAYLCYQKNKKVLLWDWDYEAPGLHYFFNKKHTDIVKKGTLELLEDFTSEMRKGIEVKSENLKYITVENITSLVPPHPDGGSIDLIAAGIYNNDFSWRANNFNWFEFYSMLDGANYIEKVKESLKNLKYDYVLIDSRTGISDYSGICNIQLPDINVMVVAPTMQNFEGCKVIIEKIKSSEYLKIKKRSPKILPVLSRLDRSNPVYNDWVKRFTEYFSDIILNLDNAFDKEYLEEIFADIYYKDTFIAYTPAISAGENILFERNTIVSRTDINRPFRNIAELIENLKNDGNVSFYKRFDESIWLDYANDNLKLNNNRKAAIAFTQVGIKQRDAAIQLENCERAIEIDKDYFLSYYSAGTACISMGNFPKAVDFLTIAVEKFPDYVEANYNLALAYYNCAKIESALKYFKKTVELKPDHRDAYEYLKVLEKEEQPDLTNTQLKRSIELEREEKIKIEKELIQNVRKAVRTTKYTIATLSFVILLSFTTFYTKKHYDAKEYLTVFSQSLDSLKSKSGKDLQEANCRLANSDNKYDDSYIRGIQDSLSKYCEQYRNLETDINRSDSIITKAGSAILFDSSLSKSIFEKAAKIDKIEMILNAKVAQINPDINSTMRHKLMSDIFVLNAEINNIIVMDTLLSKTSMANELFVQSQFKIDSILKTDSSSRTKLSPAPDNIISIKTGWFKKGCFLQFDNIRLLLADLLNTENIVVVEVSDTMGSASVLNSPLFTFDLKINKPVTTLSLRRKKFETFYFNNFIYNIVLDKIDRAGKNPFTLAAYITLQQFKAESGDNILIDGFPCGLGGSATKGSAAYKENIYKNRYDTPVFSDFDKTITFNSLIGNGTDDQNKFSSQDAVNITGYVSSVKTGGPESCNCNTANDYFKDTHIEIVADLKADSQNKRVIVKVTPRMRLIMAKQGIDWGTENLNQLLTGHKIIVTGWLFFDSMYLKESYNYDNNDKEGGPNWRATCWEVHPVTQIDLPYLNRQIPKKLKNKAK